MRYPACEKLEIIGLVERSHLPAQQTLAMSGMPRTTFYRWQERYRLEGCDALADKTPRPARVCNRSPDEVRDRLITLALEQSGAERARVSGNVHGYHGLLCIGKLGLPSSEGPCSDHQPGFHCHAGCP